MTNHPNRSKKPSVQGVEIWQGKTGAWCWAYRIGNKIVQGSLWVRSGDGGDDGLAVLGDVGMRRS